MRIVFLNPIGNIGGAERVLLTALSGINRELPSATIRLITLTDGPLLDAARALGVQAEVVALPASLSQIGDSRLSGGRTGLALRSLIYFPKLASYSLRLRAAVARYGPDLVHSNGIKTHLLTRFVVSPQTPVLWHLHDFYSLRPVARWLLQRMCSRVAAAIAVSKAVAADARNLAPRLRTEVITNAVDLDHFAPGTGNGDELDHWSGLPALPGLVRIGLIATYARWKGQLVVLDAAAKLLKQAPELPIRWYIVGGPIYQTAAQFTEAELRAEVTARGLADRVGLVPFVADPAPIYRSLDIVLHTSTQPEPFGLTVAEAMACGRAVIATTCGGTAELFTDGEDALGVQPGDVDQLVRAVRRLVEDSDLRAQLGAAARRTAENRFDANRYGAELCRIYRSVVP